MRTREMYKTENLVLSEGGGGGLGVWQQQEQTIVLRGYMPNAFPIFTTNSKIQSRELEQFIWLISLL